MSGRAEDKEVPLPADDDNGSGNVDDMLVDVGSPVFFSSMVAKSDNADDLEEVGYVETGDEEGASSSTPDGEGGGGAKVNAAGAAGHLVEGDYFPEATASVLEEIESQANEEDEKEAEESGEVRAEQTHGTTAEATAKAGGNEHHAVEAAAPPPTPPRAARPATRKRVCWSGNLIKRVTTFYMPDRHVAPLAPVTGSDAGSPTFAPLAVAPAPPSIFSEKTNTDGSTYKRCKAQRPSQRFTDWKRLAQLPVGAAAVASAPPLPCQPRGRDECGKDAPTLFAALYRGAACCAGTTSAVARRRSELHARSRPAAAAPPAARCPQLPYADPSSLFDEPQPLPL